MLSIILSAQNGSRGVFVVMGSEMINRTVFYNGRWNFQHMVMTDVLAMCIS